MFSIDYYVIPLEEFNLVLSIRWLETLGPILWDFANKTMSFWRTNHMVMWHGLGARPIAPQALSCTELDGGTAQLIFGGVRPTHRTTTRVCPQPPHSSAAKDSSSGSPPVPLPTVTQR